jgi:hypothetical protein
MLHINGISKKFSGKVREGLRGTRFNKTQTLSFVLLLSVSGVPKLAGRVLPAL